MHIEKTCGGCALFKHFKGVCPYLKAQVNPQQSACANYSNRVEVCAVCGHPTVAPILDLTVGGQPHWICDDCQKASSACSTCKYGQQCAFETDPSPIPKTIQKRFQQGNMITVTQIMNPERIEKTCKNGCTCFDPEYGCFKQNGCCGKHKIVYDG